MGLRMDRFEYAVGLISLIVGLALADIAVSLHRLIKHRAEVRWSAFSILAVTLVAFQCIAMWYDSWFLRTVADRFSIFFYITILLELFLLFLAASAVLPDEREDGWDLAVYHDRQRRYLWTLMSLFYLSYGLHWLYFQATTGRADRLVAEAWMPLLPLAFAGALIWAKGPRLRVLLVAALLAVQVGAYARSAF